MTKWEYKELIRYPDADSSELNTLGLDGWELVQILGNIFIFKRPLTSVKTQLND